MLRVICEFTGHKPAEPIGISIQPVNFTFYYFVTRTSPDVTQMSLNITYEEIREDVREEKDPARPTGVHPGGLVKQRLFRLVWLIPGTVLLPSGENLSCRPNDAEPVAH